LPRRRRVFAERRCSLHHRSDAFGLRRSDDARLKIERGDADQMDIKVLATVFATVFIAELGDKTQLATMLYAADREVSKWTVFLVASSALIVASALGVLSVTLLSNFINERVLHYIAGVGFVLVGIWTLVRA